MLDRAAASALARRMSDVTLRPEALRELDGMHADAVAAVTGPLTNQPRAAWFLKYRANEKQNSGKNYKSNNNKNYVPSNL